LGSSSNQSPPTNARRTNQKKIAILCQNLLDSIKLYFTTNQTLRVKKAVDH
jgi:hypothetical protein